MVKVVRPLFSEAAHGRIADIGSFRRGRHGPEFIAQAQPTDRQTPRQQALRARFAAAKAAHSAITPTPFWDGQRTRYHRVPDWKTFWAGWVIQHPL
jgi:hypothetical protein